MATEIVMPKLGMVMSEGTLSKWNKETGVRVKRGDVIAEIETEKLNYDLEATEDGILHHVASVGTEIPVDGLVGYLLAEGESVPEIKQPPNLVKVDSPVSGPTNLPQQKQTGPTVRSTPGARKLATKLEVDITKVSPTGPSGRVVEEDVRSYHESTESGQSNNQTLDLINPSRSVPVEGMRKSIADHMLSSITTTAQLSFFLEIDITEAQKLRKGASSKNGETITMANLLTKACSEALEKHGKLNTILSNGKIMHFDEINIGLAVALKDGLIVPVLRNVKGKTLFEISKETTELANSAREGKLLPDSLSGGTFTISVLGSVDGFTPILNAGQTAILGVGRSVKKPVVANDKIVPREMMTISLTVDHQVVDGAVAAGFLRRLQQLVERPSRLFK